MLKVCYVISQDRVIKGPLIFVSYFQSMRHFSNFSNELKFENITIVIKK